MIPLLFISLLLLCILALFCFIIYALSSATENVQLMAVCGVLFCLASPFITYSLRTLSNTGYYLWRNLIFKTNPELLLQKHVFPSKSVLKMYKCPMFGDGAFLGAASLWFFNYALQYKTSFALAVTGQNSTDVTGQNSTGATEHHSTGRVWISDIDIFLHMNNGRYRRAMDFARLDYFASCGLLDRSLKTGSMALMVAATGRYRQALVLFQQYNIVTELVYWDQEKLYFEQSFVSRYRHDPKFVFCRNLIAMKTLKEPPSGVIRGILGRIPEVPEPSEELQHFIKCNEASSARLKKKT